MRIGDEELVDPVVFLGRRGLLSAPAAFLRPVFGQRLALDVARMRERHDHVGGRDEVLGGEVLRTVLDQGAAHAELVLAELRLDRGELVADDDRDALGLGQDVQQVLDDRHDVLVFGDDLVLFQAGQALQAHLQDFLGLRFGEAVQAVLAHAVFAFQSLGAIVIGVHDAAVRAGASEHLAHQLAVPRPVHQLGLGDRRRGRFADDADELVDVGQRHGQAFQHVAALAGLAQFEHRAPRDHLAAVLQEHDDQVAQVAQARLAIHQRHHVDAEGVLQLRLLVEVVQHHLGHFAALEFDHQAHAGFVGLVLDVADALDLLLVHQFGHALLQRLLVDLVGQLVDDDRLALPAVDVLEVAARAHDDLAAPRAIAVLHAVDAVDDARGGEVRRGDDLHDLVHRGVRVAQHVQAGIHHLVEVVRRDVRRHAHRDAGRTVHEQVGQLAGQHQRLFLAAVVVGAEIDGFLVDVSQHLVGDLRQADFRVPHGGRAVAVHGAEIALAVHQHVPQREILRHPHDRVVHGTVAVGVVLADDVPDDTGRLLIGTVPVVIEFVHREQHAAMHRLEAVPRIRQRAADDHAHRVIEITAPHLLFEADGQGFFGELGHGIGDAGSGRRRSDILGATPCRKCATHRGVKRFCPTVEGWGAVTLPCYVWHNQFSVFGDGH